MRRPSEGRTLGAADAVHGGLSGEGVDVHLVRVRVGVGIRVRVSELRPCAAAEQGAG